MEKDSHSKFKFFKAPKKNPLVRKSIVISLGLGVVILINGFAQFIYPRHELVKEYFFDPPYVFKNIDNNTTEKIKS